MKRFLTGIMVCALGTAGAQTANWNSVFMPSYPFIDTSSAVFQIDNKNDIKPLITKLQYANKKKVTILHIGDSHVQADVFTGKLRDYLGSTFGRAGRGFVFPYSTAKTHTAIDYRSLHTGKWLYAKNVERSPELPLGVMGVTSKTYDSKAQFKLIFNKESIQTDYRKLRVFCNRGPQSFDFKLITKSDTQKIDVYQNPIDSTTDEIVITLKNAETAFTFDFMKRDSSQESFEIYGISIESDQDKGILYHSVGINGAGHYAVMRENLLADHLYLIKPDAIVLDIGANDFYTKGLNIEEFKNNLTSLIQHFREHAPKAIIILSNSQDIFRGKYHLPECASFSKIVSEISHQEKVAYFDWYRVAGGYKSMTHWKAFGLANRDGVHLNRDGYDLKGKLYYLAFKNTYLKVLRKDTAVGIHIPHNDTFDQLKIDTVRKIEDLSQYQWIFHTVQRGETVWTIANKYQVSALQIKNWNHLRSFSLTRNKRLKVLVKKEEGEELVDKRNTQTVEVDTRIIPQQNPTLKSHKGKYKVHKVKRGDTLFSIARRYGATVSEIQQLNHLHGNNIRLGQKIKIP